MVCPVIFIVTTRMPADKCYLKTIEELSDSDISQSGKVE